MKVRIDQAGRIILPKPLRDRFGLRGGDELAIKLKDNTIELRPAQGDAKLKKVNTVLVYSAPGTLPNEDFIAQSRDERIDSLVGRNSR